MLCQNPIIKACIDLELISNNMSFFFKSSRQKLHRTNYTFIYKILKLELRDAYIYLRYVSMEIFKTCKIISKVLPISIENAFFVDKKLALMNYTKQKKLGLIKKSNFIYLSNLKRN